MGNNVLNEANVKLRFISYLTRYFSPIKFSLRTRI